MQDTDRRVSEEPLSAYNQAATEGTSLLIGKYLSPRVLLKYEQGLDQWSTFFINLEYFLNRNFKIETLLSQEGQSGLQVNWGREY